MGDIPKDPAQLRMLHIGDSEHLCMSIVYRDKANWRQKDKTQVQSLWPPRAGPAGLGHFWRTSIPVQPAESGPVPGLCKSLVAKVASVGR